MTFADEPLEAEVAASNAAPLEAVVAASDATASTEVLVGKNRGVEVGTKEPPELR